MSPANPLKDECEEERDIFLACLGAGIVIGTTASISAQFQDPVFGLIGISVISAGPGQAVRAYAESRGDE